MERAQPNATKAGSNRVTSTGVTSAGINSTQISFGATAATPQEMGQETGQETGQIKSDVVRYGAALPIAAVVTIGLMLTMAGLVATEFTPQDKTETATYEINPKIIDLPDPVRKLTLETLKDVEVPPPLPMIDRAKAEIPAEKIALIKGAIPVFKMQRLEKMPFEISISRTEQPINRVPPIFPNRFMQGDESGYCKVKFDVSPEGRPYNITTTLCTNSLLRSPTLKSVDKWTYSPKIVSGRPVSRSGLETTVRFDLRDERGATLPVPAGY